MPAPVPPTHAAQAPLVTWPAGQPQTAPNSGISPEEAPGTVNRGRENAIMALVFGRLYAKMSWVPDRPNVRLGGCRKGCAMGWGEGAGSGRLVVRLAIVIATAALTAGCFQPLYGERSVGGTPALRESLRSVDIQPIDVPSGGTDTRMAVQIRNDLIFNFTGGGGAQSPTYRLKIRITGGRSVIIVDQGTALPTIEAYALNATYTLSEIGSGKTVVTGNATSNLSYDNAGSQRFARISAMHDAERRAAKVISDMITTRMSSYFVSGT
jgi:LPS-assembly lipoprotein